MNSDKKTIIAKSVAMCVLFTASMTLGSLPVFLSKRYKWNSNSQNNSFVQKLLCVGGGVLLCTTFVHLLPEVAQKLQNLRNVSLQEIHYAELLMCAGFFIMYLIEELAHFCLHREDHQQTVLVRSLSVRRITSNEERVSSSSRESCVADQSLITSYEEDTNQIEHSQIEHNHSNNEEHHHNYTQGHSHFNTDDSALKTIRGLFIVLALSVHELFEGLAVGLESSSKNVWYMFGAVSAHKLVIAFCIGVELVTSGMTTSVILIYVFIFAIVSPVGIGLGLIVTSESEDSADLLSVILQGLASGTLLYVVFFEILSAERKSGLRHFLCVLFGFLIMLGIRYLEN